MQIKIIAILIVYITSTHIALSSDRNEDPLIESYNYQSVQRRLSQNDSPPLINLQQHQFLRSLDIAQGAMKAFNAIFNPIQSLQDEEEQKSQENIEILQNAIQLLTGHHDPTSLMARASTFLSDNNPTASEWKSSEYQTFLEIMIRIGILNRPEYFLQTGVNAEEPFNKNYSVIQKFLQEFTQEGALDTWITHFKENIRGQGFHPDQQKAMAELIDGFAHILRYCSSDDINDSAKDPLNKYVNSQDIQEAIELEKWLEENPTNLEYDKKQEQFKKIDDHIKNKRNQALEEIGKYIFSLLKILRPEMAAIQDMEDVLSIDRIKWAQDKRQEFERYLLREWQKPNIFESNYLKAFWEKVHRHQYGKVFYQIITESFKEQFKDSTVHHTLKTIWNLSLIDTIHVHPQEARSRMPGTSIDGFLGPNFGYDMERSKSYQKWLKNPLARASGDIVMDAYSYIVDIGRQLDIKDFLKMIERSLEKTKKNNILEHYQYKYRTFNIPFCLYLLENVFSSPLKSGKDRTITEKLLKAAKTKENLIKEAKETLIQFQTFSQNMFLLRPLNNDSSTADYYKGIVFGIGFNGKLFDSPYHSSHQNEIYLSFSDSGRKPGGYLLLEFLRHISRCSNIFNSGYDFINLSANNNFIKYKSLIRHNLNQTIKENYEIPKSSWNAHMRRYVENKQSLLENFMAQLEQDIPFDFLDSQLKTWLRKTSNWYYIPRSVNLQIAPELPEEEYCTQYAARNLLFDAIAGRSFTKEYLSLIPSLFLHWKKKILNNMDPVDLQFMQGIATFDQIPEKLKDKVLTVVDTLCHQVHPELQKFWQPVITKHFQTLVQSEKNSLNERLSAAKRSTTKFQNSLEQPKKANSKNLSVLQKKVDQATAEQNSLVQKLERLPQLPSNLLENDYLKFREEFFNDRDVAQCIEPVFSQVLGHDRFYSVFLSKKTGKTNIYDSPDSSISLQLGNKILQDVIAPCNKRCQHNVLGHLYGGDLLSPQNADRLDQMRRVHGLGEVPDQFMTFDTINTIYKEKKINNPNNDLGK